MTSIELINPTQKNKQQILEYKQEHFAYRQKHLNGSFFLENFDSYEQWLDSLKNPTRPDIISCCCFVAIRQSDQKIVGMIGLRHFFNEASNSFEDHIGYGVRPSERRKGYATEMLKLALKYNKSIGLNKVILRCYQDNIGSQKTILKNGGIFKGKTLCEACNGISNNGLPILVYWIILK